MFKSKQNGNGAARNGIIPAGTTVNWIGAGTRVEGEVQSEGDIRIDGYVKGNIDTTSKVVVGKTGFVEGNISCQNADLSGNVSGNVFVREILTLNSSAHLQGDVQTDKLVVEPGARFNGSCRMGAAVKEKTADERQPAFETR